MRYRRQLVLFLLLLVACSFLIYLVYTDVESKTITQVNSEQMVHAEQAAQGILRFFATYENTLLFLAMDTHIITMDAEGRRLIRDFYTTHADEISSVTRVDENGIILYTYPYEVLTGTDISEQGHVRQELANRTVVTSDVFTSVQGFRTVAMHVPVFDNGTYRGSMAILIPFDALAGKNVGPIRILANGRGWVVSQKSGTILFSPLADQTGRPAGDVFRNSPSVIEFIAMAGKGEVAGTSPYTLGPQNPGDSPVTFEAVYRQVRIGDSVWLIIVATPRHEILDMLQTLRLELSIIFAALCASLFFFTYYIVRARGIIREEAKRQEAEEALRESERKYRNIIAKMQDAYYRTDRMGTLVMISPSGLRLIGARSEAEVLNKPITAYFTDPKEGESMMATLLEEGSVTNREVRLTKADGTIITALANSHVLKDPDGTISGVEGIVRDVTDRKRTENALLQATKKLNLLTAITLNDIRNSLFTLTGYLELEISQTSEEKRAEYHAREKTLLHQIDLLLMVARNYQSLGINPPRWHSVSTTFLLALSHLGPSELTRNLDVDDLEVYADPLLETVFQNLIENVMHHAPSATVITLRYEKNANGLALIFQDDGPGIPDDKKDVVFRRGAVTRNGTGLFMVKEILEITGITIRETGEFGKGARFRMDIPRGGYRFPETVQEP